jgi:ribosomal-protein-serine acetyltransferase
MHDFSTFSLETPYGISLQTPVADDAEEIYSLISENREYFSTYLLWAENTSSSHYTRSFLERRIKEAKQGEAIILSITKEQSIIGFIGVEIDIWNHKGEIGYWLSKPHTKQGYMLHSAEVLVDYLFKNKVLHRIEILCAESNIESQKIPQKLGFQLEAKLKDRALTKSGYEDSLIYALINTIS